MCTFLTRLITHSTTHNTPVTANTLQKSCFYALALSCKFEHPDTLGSPESDKNTIVIQPCFSLLNWFAAFKMEKRLIIRRWANAGCRESRNSPGMGGVILWMLMQDWRKRKQAYWNAEFTCFLRVILGQWLKQHALWEWKVNLMLVSRNSEKSWLSGIVTYLPEWLTPQ